jgi:hypothetical protein
VDLETLLVSLYILVDDWWQLTHPSAPRRPGRPLSLSESEVLTLAILAQWPRFRSERDFFRYADAHLRPYFPNLVSHGQFNRRTRALEPELTVQVALSRPSATPAAGREAASSGGRWSRSDRTLLTGPRGAQPIKHAAAPERSL